MALDELGADPYQRAAISCARKGTAVFILAILGAIAGFVKGGEDGTMVGAGAGGLALLSIVIARWQLSKESLGW
eukprot:CAMPEP_0206045980 /NCGR_PEP_ID=MMETSP1466-20131121/17404_1 /ASSEMBLY_ACC=CAM_ASM_001126 /TAXON_ID=44452 /ORGANISM="Pavlova gyrans, Strain CCMP608" /LENGTH=73 /DNA_ID=CAMNT_0053420941 /DNA_START=28 /DNA_END=246 /DNA_ORIENTATION=+